VSSTSTFMPVILAGLAVAFFHAAAPTHWLPFVLVGRAQGWTTGRTLGVTALAGFGHALFTALLGVAVTGAGLIIGPRLGELFPKVVGVGLVALGLYYVIRHLIRPADLTLKQPRPRASDTAAVVSLVALLTFTPSEAVLPVYVANTGHGWVGFAILALVLTLATTAAMVLFTAVFMAGAQRLRLEVLERYELIVVGAGLCLLGLFVAFQG
jgi:nickel/cobalt transporter (NicO) family protein